MLESGEAGATARKHLDRCLTCRACETTCPSGVRYGELAEIGREMLERQAPKMRWLQRLLLAILPKPKVLRVLVALGALVRGLLPAAHRRVLRRPPRTRPLPRTGKTLLWQGCAQRVVTPEVNAHLADLLEARGLAPHASPAEQCCGGLELHFGRSARALDMMRSNVAALAGADTVVSTASGCGVTLKDYGRLLGTPEANAFAAKVRDVSEVLAGFEFGKRPVAGKRLDRIAWHPPCTLQHGQRLVGVVEDILRTTGYELLPVADSHLCCGSAGAYSLLQPEMASELKHRKARELLRHHPQAIATANIGCQTHLADAVDVPVLHWLELIE